MKAIWEDIYCNVESKMYESHLSLFKCALIEFKCGPKSNGGAVVVVAASVSATIAAVHLKIAGQIHLTIKMNS